MDRYLTPYTNITLKWFKDLNVRPKTIKLLDQNISDHLLDSGLDDFFGSDIKSKGNERKNK